MRSELKLFWLVKIANRLWSVLPAGGSLPQDVWSERHRFLVGLTWFHAGLIALLGPVLGYSWELNVKALFLGDTVLHTAGEAMIVALFAALGGWMRSSRTVRATLIGFGLVSSSAILVHLSGGYIELHFHFFVMIIFLALYQDWVPFGLAILYVAIHHGVVGVLWPWAVYNHPAAIANPWTWAGVHAFFVVAASIGSVIAWRFNETAFAQTKLILDSAGEGIYGLDTRGNATFVNPATAKMLGCDIEELIGRSMHDVMHHSKADGTPYPREECSIYAAFNKGTVHRVTEEVFWRKDGTSFPVDYVSTPIIERGELRGAVVTFRDVTGRKQAEQALREGEQRFRQIAENINEVFWITDPVNHKWVYVSPAYKEIWGRSPDHLGPILESWLGGIPPEDLNRILAAVATKQAEGTYDEEYQILRPDGSIRWIRDRAFPIRNNFGAVYRITGIAEDITERKRAGEESQRNLERVRALREMEQAITSTLDLRTVLDALLDKIDLYLPYAAATVRLFNKESGLLEPVACRNLNEEQWKVSPWQAGGGLASLVIGAKRPVMIRNLQIDRRVRSRDFYRKYGLVSYLGVPLIVKDETLGLLSFYTQEEHAFTNEEVEFLSTLAGQAAVAIHNSQLYEQIRQQAVALEQANQIKNEFLRVMSHELRTPLNVIVGYSEMIKDRVLGDVNTDQSFALTKVMVSTQDLLKMIDSILKATSIEAGEVQVESHRFALADLLDELRATYGFSTNRSLTLIWDYSSDLPAVETDREKLKHILDNLIHNAIKFTENGYVTVSVEMGPTDGKDVTAAGRSGAVRHRQSDNGQHGEFVQFKIADTGIGINKEKLPIIFDLFRQADSSETRLFGGVGLGLYIVKNFTELLGGRVEVDTDPGKGSVFTVIIPCSIVQGMTSKREDPSSRQATELNQQSGRFKSP